jgi:nicotinamide phosphoribosyltransferase
MKILPILNSDSYKQLHFLMYPQGITKLYSNMTPRSFARLGCDEAVWFGLQYYVKEYLINQWNELFFDQPKEKVVQQFKRFHKHFSFLDISTDHIEKLHDLGYLPIKIKALPEGTLVPSRVPFYTIVNTHDDFAWLVNFLETQMSTVIWDLTTNATIARMYRKILDKWAMKTVGNTAFVQWQGHDFAQRGRSSVESTLNQAGHLLSFTGTDTIPAVLMLEEYYGANIENEVVGSSVPASEHSIMTSYGKENEIDAFRRILNQFPSGIVSVVSDSFDLWKVCTEYVSEMKEEILSREGKLVIRPDSGDPVDIICGRIKTIKKPDLTNIGDDDNLVCYITGDKIFDKGLYEGRYYKGRWSGRDYNNYEIDLNDISSEEKGVVELLWDVFGGTINEQGYKVLDPHIGVIYGDAITLDRAEQICARLEAKGFASTNVVFGVGSFTYNCNTRDTLGIAVKSTYCEVDGEQREIFKDPITDDGVKKSLKGLIQVYEDNGIKVKDQCSWEEESQGLLQTVFENGKLVRETKLSEIRGRLK